MKPKLVNYFLPLIFIITGCGNHKEAAETETVSKVTVEKIASYNGMADNCYTGVVEEKNNIHLSFFSTGTITGIFVSEGQQVKKGHLIAQLDDSNAKNYYEISLLQEHKAQDAYNRIKPMYDNGSIPAIKMVEAETGLKQAKENTKMARKNLKENRLYAPSDGTIGKIYLTSGMNTGPGAMVLDLLNINTVYVKMPVPEDEIVNIKKEMSALVNIPAMKITLNGKVKEIGVVADLLSHSYPVKVEIENEGLKIRPGMVCSVSINSKSDRTGFFISSKSLQKDIHGHQFVYVLDGLNRAIKKEVKTIMLVDDKVLVSGDLHVNELVVVSGQEKLKPQMKVRII
jgi:membrane fusion protein, multidrug efflux system